MNPTIEKYIAVWGERSIHFLQSWQWGDVKKPEWQPERLIVSDYPVTILTRKIPFINRRFGYIPRLFKDQVDVEILKQICTYARQLKLTHILIDPNITDASQQSVFNQCGFTVEGKSIQPQQTNIIDLTKSEEQLWLELKPKTRQKIHKAEKLGCQIFQYTNGNEAIDRFYPIMQSVTNRTEYVFHNRSYLEKVWQEFSSLSLAKIFIVTYQGKDVAGYFLLYDQLSAYELYGGSNKEGLDVQAGFLLKWQAIVDAKKSGKISYDQWGVSPMVGDEFDPHHPMYQISIFKSSFGGEYTQFLPQLKIVFNQTGYQVYQAGKLFQKLLIKIRKLS